MVNGDQYIQLVRTLFSFLELEFGFKVRSETQRGNVFYDVEYEIEDKVISISYENISDHLEVILFLTKEGNLPDYDDKINTLHLDALNSEFLIGKTGLEFELNSKEFDKFKLTDNFELRLLKKAKELRLCLLSMN